MDWASPDGNVSLNNPKAIYQSGGLRGIGENCKYMDDICVCRKRSTREPLAKLPADGEAAVSQLSS